MTRFLLFIFLISSIAYSQEGIVSGTLKSQTDGLPLPGVSVIVKGTTRGVQTDFDGYYRIKCWVGETLIYSFVGMKSREVRVTPQLFKSQTHDAIIEEIPVKPIESDAYKKAIKDKTSAKLLIPDLQQTNRTYNKLNDYQYQKIKHIDVKNKTVNFTYFDPSIFAIFLQQL